jgi:hypothetical protein
MKVTVEQLKGIIEDGRKQDEAYILFFNRLVEVLEPFKGKKITKRIETAAVAAFPEWRVWYRVQYGMYCLTFMPKRNEWRQEDGISITLGYKNSRTGNDLFDMDAFKTNNACYGSAAAERNEKRNGNLRTIETAVKLINDYNDARRRLKEGFASSHSYHIPDYYTILRAAEIESSHI